LSADGTPAAPSPGFRYVADWGKLPPDHRFQESAGVAVDSRDNVYVFCRGERPVIVFNRDGDFLRSWGAGLFSQPHGITIGPDDELWLTDSGNHTIRKFTGEGRLLLTIGDKDKPATLQGGKPFNRPTHVALCPLSGEIYISDGYGNSRVHKYDPSGKHLLSWGQGGSGPGAFNIPHNIATDRNGTVYVADRENHRVQAFDRQGKYLYQVNNLHRPCGLCFGCCGGDPRLYVGEFGPLSPLTEKTPNLGNCISVLTLEGDLETRIGGEFAGEGPGEFVAPHSVAVDSTGSIYVAEVSYTLKGRKETPPREIRSLQKYAVAGD
jgi:DNA-binding beta-propeller fold protein YncE